jgi:predicted amidohydrolase YtcJ
LELEYQMETSPMKHGRWRLSAVICTVAIATLSGCARKAESPATSPAPGETADSIYVGGDIVTVDDARPGVEALAVKDGMILAVGSRAELVSAHQGADTTIVDLGGKTLLPAFIDAHSHYITALSVASQAKVYAPPAGPGKDVPSIIAAVEQFRVEHKVPAGTLIQAYGYDDSVMPDGRLLNRDDLDSAFPDNPVIVGHVSMHGAVLNSAALRQFNISAKSSTPPGGVIVRKPGTNEPYGLIMETAYLPVFAGLPKPTREQEVAATRAGQMLYAEAGITLAQEGATHASELEMLQRAAAAGANIIDVVAYPFMTDLDTIVAANPVSGWGRYDRHLKIGGVKITADGSPQGRTAYFTTPYLTGGPGGEKNWRGEPTMSQADLNALMKRVYDMNVPLDVHTNGDAAIDMFLEGYEFARSGDYSRPWNVTSIHSQFLRKDQIPKYVRYGIRPSFYTLHTYYFATAHENNRGAGQAAYISPMRDAIDAGLQPTNHTDFYVAPLDQMFMMWSAVNRISREGEVVGPDQRITPIEALKSQTIWAAAQYDEQDRRGSLEPGKMADLVILDRNPLKVDPMSIKDIKVIETVKEGKTIYPAP